MVGCQKENNNSNTNYPADGVVRINTNIDALNTRAAQTPYEGVNLSLSVDYGAGDGNTKTNVEWAKNTDWSTATTMLWKDAETPAKIYAYAPYVAEQADLTAIKFSATADQSVGLLSSDLVGYTNEAFVPGSSLTTKNAVDIDFKHKMTQLNIAIAIADEFEGQSVTVTGVAVKGQTAVTYNAMSGVATSTGNAVEVLASKGADNNYTVIISPQTVVAGSKLVSINMSNGETYNYPTPVSGHTFAQGTANSIKLRIGKDKITLSDEIVVNNWTAGDVITGGSANLIDRVQYELDKGEQGKTKRANSYIIPLTVNVTHKLSIERIDDYWANTDAASLYAGNNLDNTIASNPDMQIKVIWSDFKYDGLVTPMVNATEKNMLITVSDLSTVAPKGGNMIVAVTKANGTDILWSWHLWFSDIAVDKVTGVASTATEVKSTQKIMDRNLGAKSIDGAGAETYGLLYQWGRKDAFPNSVTATGEEPTIYTPANIDGAQLNLNKIRDGSIALAIQNPFTFYIDHDWVGTGIDADAVTSRRWNTSVTTLEKGTKTIFDPCPRGLRIPWGENWSGIKFALDKNNWVTTPANGGVLVTDNANTFIVASGYRSSSSGECIDIGRFSLTWSSSSKKQRAMVLEISTNDLLGSDLYRSTGCAVRPVQE